MTGKWKAITVAMIALVSIIVIAVQLGRWSTPDAIPRGDLSYAGFVEQLRVHGAGVHEDGPGSQPFLTGTDRHLTVDGAGVDVFEYSTAAGASLDATRISPDGSTITSGLGPFGASVAVVDFIAPPHWYHAGRVIVLYAGQDATLLALLRTILGAQFAGG